MAAIELEYIAKNGEFIPGVPAEDHTVDTKAEAKRLVDEGIYRIKAAKKTTKPKATKPKATEPTETPVTTESPTEKPDTGEGE